VAATATAGYLSDHLGAAGAIQSAAVHGYTTAFTVSAVLLAAAAVVTAVLIRASRSDVATDPGVELAMAAD
jgi:hypothetical protein